MNKLEKI